MDTTPQFNISFTFHEILALFPYRPLGTILICARDLLACTSIFYLASHWQMCTRSHRLLRPNSLGFHSAPNSDSPWLPENQHTWLPCCPRFFPEDTAQSPSYLCICGLNDLQSSPSHIPGHTGLPRGEMGLHSGCTHGDLGTGDSGCHSLEDTSQVNRNVHGFPRGSWPSWWGSTTWCAEQSSRLGAKEPGFQLWLPRLPAGWLGTSHSTSLSLSVLSYKMQRTHCPTQLLG